MVQFNAKGATKNVVETLVGQFVIGTLNEVIILLNLLKERDLEE